MRTLVNKVVVITGASRGIGAATARAFAREKSRLVLCGRDRESLKEVALECGLADDDFMVVVADIRTRDGMKQIVGGAFERFKRVDVFVNNAAVGYRRTVVDTCDGEFDDTFESNVKAVWYSFQELLPRFRAQGGGQIINVSSMVTKLGSPEYPVYAASKGALDTLCESVAAEVRNENIRVCVLAPGSTATDFGGTPLDQKTPRPRLSAEDVAEAILFLARQDGSAWVSRVEMRPLATK